MWHYLDAMKKNSRDEWLRGLNARQRNIVFPNTVNNEGQMWRRLGEKPMSTMQKIGLGLLGIFVFGLLFFMIAFVTEGNDLHERILAGVRFWAPVGDTRSLDFGPLMGFAGLGDKTRPTKLTPVNSAAEKQKAECSFGLLVKLETLNAKRQ